MEAESALRGVVGLWDGTVPGGRAREEAWDKVG